MAGEVTVFGPYAVGDDAAIVTALSGSVVVADDLVSHVSDRQVWFTHINA